MQRLEKLQTKEKKRKENKTKSLITDSIIFCNYLCYYPKAHDSSIRKWLEGLPQEASSLLKEQGSTALQSFI